MAKRRVCDLNKDEIKDALVECHGIVSDVAKRLECDRTQLNRKILEDDEMAEFYKNAKEILKDWVESQLLSLVKKGTPSAVIFFLKCQAKERGYVERQEVTAKDGEPLGQISVPIRATSAAEWEAQNAAA
jgi:hypothetical protein